MKLTSFRVSPLFFFVLFIAAAAINAEEDSNAVEAGTCVYTLKVKTGNVKNAGTDSGISVTLFDAGGSTVRIPNLWSWGAMGPGHNYFEKGNLDFFVVKAPCIPSKVCRILVTSDNGGNKPGWYLDYVDVITTSPDQPTTQIRFQAYRWLAISSPPYSLSFELNLCGRVQGGGGGVADHGLDITKVQAC